ncbi:hypothetical protein LTR10_022762 [Elasticomyces elasticus]|uniref:DUF7728 domain-containing protein n=1 Tax=Exophiala sideris TaxID=1016849 RepID=A0ABR0JNV8_9EURO|nr:hypothetical protein LTR10_022762 [Elasticomyces elasticus]KAK5037993.1 hypothetical protein LTS07_001460 [Exophiala sideris]KAK5043975.1 hypothetical protein LTR13_000330 [Exophiala sideris]KAK5067474.1 hypothetical protein LTR69_001462 [Exophiala sideris]KAK5184289.1 hypothetical protein LTR44_003796 [Eurotiomycetes sp. CCFEE 6388]
MHLAHALVASAFALRASAFLIPLEISKAAEQATADLARLFSNPNVVDIGLDCPGCPFFGAEDQTQPQFDVENKIHLIFGIDPEHGLTLNSVPIFPHDPTNAGIPYVVSAPQMKVEDGSQTEPVQLEFAYERLQPVTSQEDSGVTVLPLRFTILGLRGYPVKVNTISIDLLETPTQTTFARYDQIPFEDTPGATSCDTTSKWSLCRLRAIVAARLQSIMEVAKARAHGEKSRKHGGCGSKKFGGRRFVPNGRYHGHGHHMGGKHHHSHHHRAHRLGHILHQTLRFFVIPALLGVIGGLMASAVGMLVGQMISYLWTRYYRRGQRGDASVRVVEIVVSEDEKTALMDDASDLPPPPEYTDLEAGAKS